LNDIERLSRVAGEYAAQRGLVLSERLGFGIHGVVHAAESNAGFGRSAVKALAHQAPYERERDAYLRLRETGVTLVLGFHVPQLLRHDDALRVIEMTVVTRPFLLDFAGAYLDWPPEFSEAVWQAWEEEKREQFGPRWPKVQAVLAALEDYGIHMLDVSPSNIAFRD
jgi:hypothetical protein